jgi:hypothetical protein
MGSWQHKLESSEEFGSSRSREAYQDDRARQQVIPVGETISIRSILFLDSATRKILCKA